MKRWTGNCELCREEQGASTGLLSDIPTAPMESAQQHNYADQGSDGAAEAREADGGSPAPDIGHGQAQENQKPNARRFDEASLWQETVADGKRGGLLERNCEP